MFHLQQILSQIEDDKHISGCRDGLHPLIVAVEGNIGSGKSTFLQYCASKPDIDVIKEPIDQWNNVNGENLLAKFYENPQRWAMQLQVHIGMTILDIYKRHSHKPIKIIERSMLSSRHCFLENLCRTGIVDPTTYTILNNWYNRIQADIRTQPYAIVYLQTSPIVAYDRMLQRARGEEVNINLEYITNLHNLHEEWISRVHTTNLSGESDFPIHVINGDLPLIQLYHHYEECLSFINLLCQI